VLLEHFESSGLHAREHVHQTGLDTDRFLASGLKVVAELGQEI
jgi:hypothetical protein